MVLTVCACTFALDRIPEAIFGCNQAIPTSMKLFSKAQSPPGFPNSVAVITVRVAGIMQEYVESAPMNV